MAANKIVSHRIAIRWQQSWEPALFGSKDRLPLTDSLLQGHFWPPNEQFYFLLLPLENRVGKSFFSR